MSAHRYEITVKSAMMWANSELEHIGRIASMKDADLQYAYAMSTLNGMAHLKDALYELVTDPAYEHHHTDLQKTHDAVVRTMRYLVKTYNLDLEAIKAFNTRHTLSNLGYLEEDVGSPEYPEYPEMVEPPQTPSDSNNGQESPEYQPKDTLERMQDGGRRRKRSYKRKGKSRKAKKTRKQ